MKEIKIGDVITGDVLATYDLENFDDNQVETGKVIEIDEDDPYAPYLIETSIKKQYWLKSEGVTKLTIDEKPNLIDNQPHYKNQGIEPIDLMRKNFSKEEFAGFLQGNVLKYMLRYKDKNGVEDLKKAKTYLSWLIEEEENAEV